MLKIYKAKWILPANKQVFENNALLIESNKILEIIPENQLGNFDSSIPVVDYDNAIITPGFINLHTHLQFTSLDQNIINQPDKNFANWVINLMQAYSKLGWQEKIESVKQGIQEEVLSGTTCIAQISREEEFIDIFKNSNIRIYLFLETFSKNEEISNKEFNCLKEKINSVKAINSDLLTVGISPHSIYNVHPFLWKKITDFASKNNYLVQTHFAESKEEIQWLQKGYSDIDLIHKFVGWEKISPLKANFNPVQYLEELDILKSLGKNLILTHLNQLNERYIKKLQDYDTKLVHCPRSNLILHNKTIDIGKLKNLNYPLNNIGIGTDSKFSNYDLNIINEIRTIKNKTDLDLLDLLDMVTINAAKILQLDDKIGSLEKGKEADFLVFRLNNNENYLDFINKERPDNIYVQGKQIVINKELINLFK